MTRYFFNLQEGAAVVVDDEGRDLSDRDMVRTVAVREARGIMCADINDGVLRLGSRIVVEDAQRHEIVSVEFRDAISLADP